MFGFNKKDKANQLKEDPAKLSKEDQEKIMNRVQQILKEPREEKPGKGAKSEEAGSEAGGKVTRDTPIGVAAKSSPHAAEILMSYGLHCIGCGMTAYETIEQGCAGHGMSDGEISALVDELNEAAEDFDREISESM